MESASCSPRSSKMPVTIGEISSSSARKAPITSVPSVNLDIVAEKRKQAKSHIANIATLDDAIALLNKLCDEAGEWLLDKINS